MVDVAGVDVAALTGLGRNRLALRTSTWCVACGRRGVVDVAWWMWRGRRGMVVNAHIPQHEGRGKGVVWVVGT